MTTQELKQSIEKVLGNNIRCLLPSYWWKRLFNQVADRIEDVEQSTSQLIDSKVEEVKMPIVESESELYGLKIEEGSLAAVVGGGPRKFSECFQANYDELVFPLSDNRLARIQGIGVNYVNNVTDDFIVSILNKTNTKKIWLSVSKDLVGAADISTGQEFIFYRSSDSTVIQEALDVFNAYLKEDEFYYIATSFSSNMGNMSLEIVDNYFSIQATSDLYIKGDSWERLAKESDLVGNEGDNVVIIYANEESTRNTNAFNTIIDCYENEKPYVAVVKIDEMLYSANITIQKVNDRYGIMAQCINTAYNKVYGVLLGLSVETGVGLANLLTESELITIDSELSDTSKNPVQNKAITAALNEKQDKCINLINVGICNTFDELYDKLKDEQISLTIFLTGNIGGRIIINDQCVLMHVTDSYILIHTESASFASYRETQTIAVYDKNSNVCIGDKEHPVYSNWKEINVAALGSYVENSFPSFRVCYMINVENQSQLERKYSIHYPLSIERFPNSQVDFPEYYECVVYVNNTFERWRIYADGDIEKIS